MTLFCCGVVRWQMRAVASLLLRDVPGYRVRDSSFWTLAYRQLVHARPGNGPEHLYERLLPYLNSRPLLSNVPAGLSRDVRIIFVECLITLIIGTFYLAYSYVFRRRFPLLAVFVVFSCCCL